MNGSLELRVDRQDGRPRIARLRHRVPMHAGKACREGDALIAHVVNPTAGWFPGDQASLHVHVDGGARLSLCSPSANRAHPGREPADAVLNQLFEVGAGSSLEYVPEALIPFAGSRLRQSTTLRVDPGAELIWFDWVMPGRLARGERFAFTRLQLALDVWTPQGLSLRERAVLSPADLSCVPWKQGGQDATLLTAVLFGWEASEVRPLAERAEQAASSGTLLGSGALAKGGVLVRAICASPLAARRALVALRGALHASRGRTPPSLGAGF